jgi:hypothetical protein
MSAKPAAPIDPADVAILDAWLYASTHLEAERHAAVTQLAARRPDLGQTTRDGAPLLAGVLDLVATEGDIGRRARQLAELLLERGADVEAHRDDEPLLLAHARFARLPAIDILLRHGARPDPRDAQGWTPLHWVATLPERPGGPIDQHIRNLGAAARLLAAGAPVDARDDAGKTPLALAAFLGHRKIAGVLVHAGADIDSVDADGRSILAACKLRVSDSPGQPRFASDDEAAMTRTVIDWLTARGARTIEPTDE